jgi:hypothetical protein
VHVSSLTVVSWSIMAGKVSLPLPVLAGLADTLH